MALQEEIARTQRALKVVIREEQTLTRQLMSTQQRKLLIVHRIGRLREDLATLDLTEEIEALELSERGKLMDSSE